MKIIEKINEKIKNNENFYSFEYFPPKTEGGIENLLERVERMGQMNPLWVDMTWGAGGTTSESTLFLSSYIQNYLNLDVLMHLTCRSLTREKIDQTLEEAKANGIVNLLVLRGDPPTGINYDHSKDYFQYAEDLVKYIREKYADFFCICVAGYPAMHIESKNKEEDLYYLKRKCDAGADLIITQLFYDPDEYLEYLTACSNYGINLPNLPGLLPVQNYNSFKRIVNMCRVKVPEDLQNELEAVKADDEKVKEVGIAHCTKVCKKLLAKGVLGLHFYTMNLEKSVGEVIKNLGVKISQKARDLPWRKHSNPKRTQENVRPIFWKYNSKSYLSKTWYWDEYPNGIWGDSRSPAFGNVTEHFVSFCKDYIKESKKFKQLKKMWREVITGIKDVEEVFIDYIEGKIKKLPWCEESELQNEIVYIKDLLVKLNHHGVLTINSQPSVNGKPSNDPYFGWGPQDGYVYQKMYIEFFLDKAKLEKLISVMKNFTSINYQAVNHVGDIIQGFQNTNQKDPNSIQPIVCALTWGVFPNREIIQPTIYDSEVFLVWKDEAFNAWNDWIRIYQEDENKSPESVNILNKIKEEYYLVTIFDNDYINPKLEKMFEEFFKLCEENQ